jgi:alkanesulfonate monooxygenase SsuD/methylene tetrahydromethanopterin reductase-like flavin-dependent oxidoreductase (luciferase family)
VARNALPHRFDPLLVKSALAGVTERIGLVATVSTRYLPPYHLARKRVVKYDQMVGIPLPK